MKIGEENLMRLEPAILDRLRLLHLDDHFGVGEHRFGCGQNVGAGLLVGRVVGEDPGACAGLHQDFVPARRQLANRARHEPNPELIALDLCRNADAHDVLRFQDLASLETQNGRNREKIVGVLFSECDKIRKISAI